MSDWLLTPALHRISSGIHPQSSPKKCRLSESFVGVVSTNGLKIIALSLARFSIKNPTLDDYELGRCTLIRYDGDSVKGR